MDILTVAELKKLINKRDTGILFCFGKSFISKLIQANTRRDYRELVPSHIALIIDGTFLYESTSQDSKLGNKTIPAGVRRYLLKDFYRLEKDKETEYSFFPCEVNKRELEKYVHYPYGKDIILDFVLKHGSDGESRGLICSQYANKVTNIVDMPCPSPVDLYRKAKTMEEQQ